MQSFNQVDASMTANKMQKAFYYSTLEYAEHLDAEIKKVNSEFVSPMDRTLSTQNESEFAQHASENRGKKAEEKTPKPEFTFTMEKNVYETGSDGKRKITGTEKLDKKKTKIISFGVESTMTLQGILSVYLGDIVKFHAAHGTLTSDCETAFTQYLQNNDRQLSLVILQASAYNIEQVLAQVHAGLDSYLMTALNKHFNGNTGPGFPVLLNKFVNFIKIMSALAATAFIEGQSKTKCTDKNIRVFVRSIAMSTGIQVNELVFKEIADYVNTRLQRREEAKNKKKNSGDSDVVETGAANDDEDF